MLTVAQFYKVCPHPIPAPTAVGAGYEARHQGKLCCRRVGSHSSPSLIARPSESRTADTLHDSPSHPRAKSTGYSKTNYNKIKNGLKPFLSMRTRVMELYPEKLRQFFFIKPNRHFTINKNNRHTSLSAFFYHFLPPSRVC